MHISLRRDIHFRVREKCQRPVPCKVPGNLRRAAGSRGAPGAGEGTARDRMGIRRTSLVPQMFW